MNLIFKNGVLDGQTKHVDGDWSQIERVGITEGDQVVDTYRLARVVDGNNREFHQVPGLVLNPGTAPQNPSLPNPGARDRLLPK